MVDPSADLREALDIDCVDFLNFVKAIHHRLGVNIAEVDYAKLVTLAEAVTYLEDKMKRGLTPLIKRLLRRRSAIER